jgi:uncharacterized lipoprotein YbaY
MGTGRLSHNSRSVRAPKRYRLDTAIHPASKLLFFASIRFARDGRTSWQPDVCNFADM